jgi:transcriptional regulator of NAD metabolism
MFEHLDADKQKDVQKLLAKINHFVEMLNKLTGQVHAVTPATPIKSTRKGDAVQKEG